MKIHFWHRWSYNQVYVEHILGVAPGPTSRCGAHENGAHHFNTVRVRFCFGCSRLEGEDLPGGKSYDWDDWNRGVVENQDGKGFISGWKWPFRDEVMRLGGWS